MPVNQLRKLEEDGVLERTIYAAIQLRVEYKIKKYGLSLMPIINVIQLLGEKNMKKNVK